MKLGSSHYTLLILHVRSPQVAYLEVWALLACTALFWEIRSHNCSHVLYTWSFQVTSELLRPKGVASRKDAGTIASAIETNLVVCAVSPALALTATVAPQLKSTK